MVNLEMFGAGLVMSRQRINKGTCFLGCLTGLDSCFPFIVFSTSSTSRTSLTPCVGSCIS